MLHFHLQQQFYYSIQDLLSYLLSQQLRAPGRCILWQIQQEHRYSLHLHTIEGLHSDDDIIIGGYYETEKGVSHTIPPQNVTLLTLLKYTINHQATFTKKALFDKRLYDESYMIMADAKFNFQSIIIDNCSVKITKDIIADYDTNGISSNYELYKAERQRFLKELFPERVIQDYVTMFTPEEVPLVSLLPELKLSPTIQRWVYRFANFFIRLKHSTK